MTLWGHYEFLSVFDGVVESPGGYDGSGGTRPTAAAVLALVMQVAQCLVVLSLTPTPTVFLCVCALALVFFVFTFVFVFIVDIIVTENVAFVEPIALVSQWVHLRVGV